MAQSLPEGDSSFFCDMTHFRKLHSELHVVVGLCSEGFSGSLTLLLSNPEVEGTLLERLSFANRLTARRSLPAGQGWELED